jgi:hypothetical protein
MATAEKKTDASTKKIESLLRTQFPETEAYRYNHYSIRIRVLDDGFAGKSNPEREASVLPLLAGLPNKVKDDITLLLLLAPDEAKASLMNLEFDDPGRSML